MERTIAAIVGALIIAGAAIGLWKVSIYALQIVATPIGRIQKADAPRPLASGELQRTGCELCKLVTGDDDATD